MDEATEFAPSELRESVDHSFRYVLGNGAEGVAFGHLIGIVDSHSDLGVGATVIEIPFPLEIGEALDEDCSVGILSGLLVGSHRAEEGTVETGNRLKRIFEAEEHLACGVGSAGERRVALHVGAVLSVINQHYTLVGNDCRRTAFRQVAVEVEVARLDEFLEVVVFSFNDGSPVHQIVGDGCIDCILAPVHQIFLLAVDFDLGGILVAIFVDFCHDGTRLAEEVFEFSAIGGEEGDAAFLPGHEVVGSGDCQAGGVAVPRRVGHHVKDGAVGFLRSHHAGILASAGAVLGVLLIGQREFGAVGIEHRSGLALCLGDAVFCDEHSDARGAGAQTGIGIVLGAVEHIDLAVFHYRSGVERVGRFPGDVAV